MVLNMKNCISKLFIKLFIKKKPEQERHVDKRHITVSGMKQL